MTGNDDGHDDQLPPAQGGPRGPIKDTMRAPLPRRFYTKVEVRPTEGEGAYEVVLDGRRLRTPGKREVKLPNEPLANLMRDEWAAQGEVVNPATMPVTRIVNTAIDGVAANLDAVAADVASYAGSDLLCYRAEGPADLIAKQDAAWSPILATIEQDLDICMRQAKGVMPVTQPGVVQQRIQAALGDFDAFQLTALHVVTTLTGSAVLALALQWGHVGPDTAWAAAHVDEDWQIALWGEDEEATARRAGRRAEFDAAYRVLTARG